MRGQQLFFATRNDLRSGLETIESEWELEYMFHELRDDGDFAVWTSLLNAPGLGISKSGQRMTDDGHLVYLRDEKPRVRSEPQRSSGIKYDVELGGAMVLFLPACFTRRAVRWCPHGWLRW